MPVFDRRNNSIYGVDENPLQSSKLETLEKLIEGLVGPDFEVIENVRLRSKKNVVLHLILKPFGSQETVNLIAKAFVTGNYDVELKLLKQSAENGLSVPKIIAAKDGVLLLDYIEGEILVDRIHRTFDAALIDDLAHWYYDFHRSQPLLKGDPRLRNFIVADDGLFGVDFEEASKGHWTVDLGGIAASLLDTDPINDPRKRLMVWNLLDKYLELKGIERTHDIDKDYISVISETLKQTAQWRKSEVLSDLANQIQKNGIPL
ncbi:MAG: hypothetical protein P1Q69_03710 [Candidatus Thorarchaeota archaeon]|nr:hypothetical protein [Candidatus Thorarchaeota archaeon]